MVDYSKWVVNGDTDKNERKNTTTPRLNTV